MKDGSKSKMESGSKDLCGDSTGKKNTEKKQRRYVYRSTKKFESNALKWKNRRKGMRARRLQMGCNIIE